MHKIRNLQTVYFETFKWSSCVKWFLISIRRLSRHCQCQCAQLYTIWSMRENGSSQRAFEICWRRLSKKAQRIAKLANTGIVDSVALPWKVGRILSGHVQELVLIVKFLPLQMTLQWSLSALLWLPWREIVIVPFVDDTAHNAFAAVLLWSRIDCSLGVVDPVVTEWILESPHGQYVWVVYIATHVAAVEWSHDLSGSYICFDYLFILNLYLWLNSISFIKKTI